MVANSAHIVTMLKSVGLGLAGGLLAFSATGWIVYSALWQYTGQNEIMRDTGTPGVVLGGVWCLGWGLIAGATVGIIAAVVIALYTYRRRRR